MNKLAPALPSLIFGERQTKVAQGFHGMVDQFSHLTPKCDYDTKSRKGFFYKGNVLNIDGIVINQNYYSHMLAVSPVENHNILIPLAGTHHGIWRGSKLKAQRDQGFFIPRNDRFQFETDLDAIAGSLIVTYDLTRLNRVIMVMTSSEDLLVREDHVRCLPLNYGTINFKKLFIALFSQIDGFAGDVDLLKLNGFDDQFYRLLAMTLRPDFFLNQEVIAKACKTAFRDEAISRFETYVEENIDKVIVLSELEAQLGVGARALQYACNRRHGCSPRVYIRNRKLDFAYGRLASGTAPANLAALAFELGFSSQSQFSKFFRERFGVSPSQV